MLEAIVATIALSAPMPTSSQEPPPPRVQQRDRSPGMGEARPDRGGRPGPGSPPRGEMLRGEGMGPAGEIWREFAGMWEQIEPERRERIREEMRREFEGMQERFRREMGERLRGEADERMRRDARGQRSEEGPRSDRARRERPQRPDAMGDGPGMRDRLREAMRRNPDAVREAIRQRLADRAGRGGMPPRMQRGMMGGRGQAMPPAMRGGPGGPRYGGMGMGRGGPRGGAARGGEGCCCSKAGPGPKRPQRGGARLR